MITIHATIPCTTPPAWALLERLLFTSMAEAASLFVQKFTKPDGGFIWRTSGFDNWQIRDGVDDFYESFFNWPLFYLLGGSADMLTLSHQQWHGITEQLTAFGLLHNEFDRGYDWFHMGEGYAFLFHLCMADPTHPQLRERATRFAGLYLNEDANAANYDSTHNIIRAPHNGSEGPREGYFDTEPIYPWVQFMKPYGLPYHDLADITTYDDLQDPRLGRRMGEAMQERMGKGDVAGNLVATSLLTNAFLLTADEKYKHWVTRYVQGWIQRAQENQGIIPDNVGLSGVVGEYVNGKWYGGLYGWAWPHGFHNIGAATTIAGINAFLLTNESAYLDLPRQQIDALLARGKTLTRSAWDPTPSARSEEFAPTFYHLHAGEAFNTGHTIFVVPFRHNDHGWFDYQSLSLVYPTALWNIAHAAQDWERINYLHTLSNYEWQPVYNVRTKEENGHEEPWLSFLSGENPDYPERILQVAYAQVARRTALIRQDQAYLPQVDINHWQGHNPILIEALTQLTLGSPPPIYNGGLFHSHLRYFDATCRRPGLPDSVAALVSRVDNEGVTVRLINLSIVNTSDLIIQAGSLGQHQFLNASYSVLSSNYPGSRGVPGHIRVQTSMQSIAIHDTYLHIHLPASTEITLELEIQRFVHPPSYHYRGSWPNVSSQSM